MCPQVRGGPLRFELSSWLQIEGAEPKDSGTYRCIARNDLGSVSASAVLGILGAGSTASTADHANSASSSNSANRANNARSANSSKDLFILYVRSAFHVFNAYTSGRVQFLIWGLFSDASVA